MPIVASTGEGSRLQTLDMFLAAVQAEAAATAGENSFRSFVIVVQRCASSVAILQQYFSNSIAWLLLPVDGAHVASCEEIETAVSSIEGTAQKGHILCINTMMARSGVLCFPYHLFNFDAPFAV
ncbi:hypothetical protein J5N97_009655 [Dioscorea zingiberensis]|uniref:Exocyst complex component Sec10-like alpha-helical bundle domain-containing protein n=1 Tax=Dioscorea zingiberensis TaxID=325984 RepID=A0A9D5CZW1_9LILI|nr:hypothetical protein J5N97_009655 [Dioscorea zingiberensis]